MAQSPKPGIPSAPPNPTDPNAGRNIHGQPNRPPPSDEEQRALDAANRQPPSSQVNIHGHPPQSHMAPPEEPLSGLGDNTRAEMEAGRRNLQQYTRRNDAEHEAGRAALQQRNPTQQ